MTNRDFGVHVSGLLLILLVQLAIGLAAVHFIARCELAGDTPSRARVAAAAPAVLSP